MRETPSLCRAMVWREMAAWAAASKALAAFSVGAGMGGNPGKDRVHFICQAEP